MDWGFPLPDTPEEAAELIRRVRMAGPIPGECIYPETKEPHARRQVAVAQMKAFVRILKRYHDDLAGNEFPELFAYICNMTAPYYAALGPQPWAEGTFGPAEHWDKHCDTILSAMILVIDTLRTQVLDGKCDAQLTTQRMNILRRYFPDHLPQGMVTEEERRELMRSRKGATDDIYRARAVAWVLSKKLFFEISPESPVFGG